MLSMHQQTHTRPRCGGNSGTAARSRYHVGSNLRSPRLVVTAATPPGHHHHLTLHAGNDTTISVPFTAAQAAQLDAAFKALLNTFAEKAKAERPRRWESMEVRFVAGASSNGNGAAPAGSADAPLELFEAFCNPNAHSSVVDAKVLLTARAAGGGLSVTTEARLSAVRADLDHFLAAVAPGSGGGSSGS